MARPLTASIIVTNHNNGRLVGNAIKSTLRQTYPHTEVLVIDDGSTDESRDVIARYEDRLVTILKPHGGKASALNLAFPMTRGDGIYLLDADDVLDEEAVERSIGTFEDPSVVKVHWPKRLVDHQGTDTGMVQPKHLPMGNLRSRSIEIGPAFHLSMPTSGYAWSRSLLKELLPVREQDFRNDVDSYLTAMASLIGRFATAAESLSRNRLHGINSSRTLGARRRLQQWEMLASYMQQYLATEGIDISMDEWRARNGYVQSLHAVLTATREIDQLVPAHEPIILIAPELFVPDEFAVGRTVLTLAAGDWEREEVEELALQLVEQHAQNGSNYLAIAGIRFRAPGRLSRFVQVVRDELEIVLDNERMLVCRLARAAPGQ